MRHGDKSGGTVNLGTISPGAEEHGISRHAGVIFDILLFCISGVGMAGAFLETLLVDWRSEFDQPLLWGGLLAFCVVSALWWAGCRKDDHTKHGKNGKSRRLWAVWRTMALICVYGAALFLYGETIVRGFIWSFRNGLELFGEYYGGEGALQYGEELLERIAEGGGDTAQVRTLGFLAVLFPVFMLTGFIYARGKWQVFLIENVLWFAAACITDVFPGIPFVTLCVTGIILAASAGEFRDSRAAWVQASAGIVVLCFLGILFIERLALPVINEQYERGAGLRHEFYLTVNYKWLPGLQKLFNGSGFGAGVDVTGAFGRQGRVSGIMTDVYRVTLDAAPRRTLYLRGFVGAGYSRRRWEPEDEGALERYYRDNGFSLYEGGRELINMSFAAVRDNGRTSTVTIEELLGKGKYSLLPYGAFVTEAYTVHSGGAVDRIDGSYSFRYREMLGVEELTEQWKQIEEQYRQYAYDSFLDYPEERLPQLTLTLKEAGLPVGDVYGCAAAIIELLEEKGTYRLDVAATPVGKDFVEYFLFDSHEGYCAHFASAAVLMFRYCGIPARYATGYSVSAAGFSRTQENVYTAGLTGAQAHAWAEVYVDGVGWVPVETTPGAAAFAGDNRAEMLRRLGILTGSIEPTVGGSVVIDDDEEEEEEPEESVGLPLLPYEDEEESEEMEENETQIRQTGGLKGIIFRVLLIAVPAAAVLFVLLGRVRRLLWNKRLERVGGQEKVFLLYRNMRSALCVMGCPRKLALTGEAFWERLHKVLCSLSREEYEALCDLLEQSSFGNRAPSGEELETLACLHDNMVSRLYLNAPFYKKPAFAGLGCVLPASFRTYSLKRF